MKRANARHCAAVSGWRESLISSRLIKSSSDSSNSFGVTNVSTDHLTSFLGCVSDEHVE